MFESISLNKEQEGKVLGKVQSTFKYYQDQLNVYRSKWLANFQATYIFQNPRRGNGRSSLHFPKVFENVERIAPRLTANDPKFVILPLTDSNPIVEESNPALMLKSAEAGMKYLHYAWEIGKGRLKLQQWAKGGLVYDVMFAKATYSKVIGTDVVDSRREVEVSEDGLEVEMQVDTEVTETVVEYPTYEIPDIFEVYFDPRRSFVDDMESILLNRNRVKLADILMYEDELLPGAVEIVKKEEGGEDFSNDNKLDTKFNLQGLPETESHKVGKNISTYNLKEFYGYMEFEKGDERLVEIWVLNNKHIIKAQEIPFIPFEMYSPSTVPNQGVGVGAVSPVLDIHKAYNLVRNQRFENVSMVMNRMWKLKQGAGIDPKRLRSMPGNVIPVRDMDGLEVIDTPDVTRSSFQEANALNTEMQATLGTIDTTQDSTSNSFNNLATGQKIRWNQFDSKMQSFKENLEDALARLGKKMLVLTAYRATKNPKVYDNITKQFYEVAKEVFRGFDKFFDVKVEANSTAFDSLENMRDEALAKAQISLEYSERGVPIDLKEVYTDIMRTFPGSNPEKYIMDQPVQSGTSQGALPGSVVKQAQAPVDPAETLTRNLANV